MSAVRVNEATQVGHFDGHTRILSERTEIYRTTQRKASEHVDESWAVSLLDTNELHEKDNVSAPSLPSVKKVSPSSKSSVVAFNKKIS
ncbi:MAG: hypothetical protein ACJASG_001661, partial [Oleiphilaceae bacterium]